MKINIKGIKVKYIRLSDKKYNKLHNSGKDVKEHSMAHYDRDDKILTFSSEHFSLKLVRHEVMHAFINNCFMHSCTDITMEDYEEFVCEIVEQHLPDIDRISKKIYKDLK